MKPTRRYSEDASDMVAQVYRHYLIVADVEQAAKILEQGYRGLPRITARVHGLYRDTDWIQQQGVLVSDQPDPRTECVVELECRMTERRLKRLELESLRHGVRYFLLYDASTNLKKLRLLSTEEIAAAAIRWEKDFIGHDPLAWFEKRPLDKTT